jgi:hypothetical protein
MNSVKSLVLCLLILSFYACKKQQKTPEIHQIRFGSIDGNSSGNRTNRGYKFSYFMQIDLHADTFLLKVSQNYMQEFEDGKKPAKYYTGKIPDVLKNETENFKSYVLTKKSGPKFKNEEEVTTLYCGPLTFLEYRKNTVVRYFYVKHWRSNEGYDSLLGDFSEKLYDFALERKSLKPAKAKYDLKDDSLIAPIVKRMDFSHNVPPPPVQKTIKFTPPIEIK